MLARSFPMKSCGSQTSTIASQEGAHKLEALSRLASPLRHPRDPGAERVEALFDALIAALDLIGVVDGADALGAYRGQQHGHAGADVGRYHRRALEAARSGHDRPVWIAQHDAPT